MQNDSLHKLTLAALFSALDYILALFQFRIPSPVGHPFVDLGFNFVALGVLFLGYKYGLLSGAVGLLVFDLLNGYANHAYLTVMEVILLTTGTYLAWTLLKKNVSLPAIITLGVVSGLLKMGTGYLRYLIEALVDAGLPLPKAAVTALAAFPADFATGVSMFIVIPLFFLALNKVSHQLHWNWYQQYQ